MFPTKMKFMMLAVMAVTLLFIVATTGNIKAVLYSGSFMIFGAVWGWRYPGSVEEYQIRVANKRRIGWIK